MIRSVSLHLVEASGSNERAFATTEQGLPILRRFTSELKTY